MLFSFVQDPYQPPDNFPKTDDGEQFVFSETEPPPQTTRPTTTTTTTTTTRKPPPEGHDRGATNVPINRSTSFFAQPGILAGKGVLLTLDNLTTVYRPFADYIV